MRAFSLVIEPKLVKEVDELIKKHGFYSSRSDFIRDAIRARLLEIKHILLEEDFARKEAASAHEDDSTGPLVDEVMREQHDRFYGVH